MEVHEFSSWPPEELEGVSVVLVRPRSSENVGAAARAMCNMGVGHLILVAPIRWDMKAASRLATSKAAPILQQLRIVEDLDEALSPFQFVVGTSARRGGLREEFWTPERAALEVMGLLPRNRVALLFGPEDRGLTNEELERCQALVRIPTAQFASLNVAQAVLILCYELHKARRIPIPRRRVPRLASAEELEAMYRHLRETLTQISLIHPSYADHGMRKVRQFLSRVRLRRNEVRMIRGLCRQIHWYAETRHRQALSRENEGEKPRGPSDRTPGTSAPNS